MRYAAFLLLLCACSSLSYEDRDQLALNQRNAQYYYEGNRLDQAMGQCERGLEIDPDDYKLNTIKGAILLKTSGSALGQDHRMLDEATAVLAQVYESRSPNRHEPSLLMTYALALQKQGRRHLGEAVSLRDQATRAQDKQPLLDQASRAQEQANDKLVQARDLLEVLIERGELLRLCHYHTLLIAQDLRDTEAFDAAAKAYLEQLAKEQEAVERNITQTPIPGFEQEQLQLRQTLKQEELEVRVLLAEQHYLRKQYEPALAMLDRVLEIDPSRSVDYYNRGRLLLELNRQQDAKEDFKRFIQTTNLPADNQKRTFAATVLKQ